MPIRTAAALGFGVLLAAVTSLAEQPEAAAPPAEIRIRPLDLEPEKLALARASAFILRNESGSLASLEFAFEEARPIPCTLDNGSQPLGDLIVLGVGQTLRCTAWHEGEFSFRAARGEVVSHGRISVW